VGKAIGNTPLYPLHPADDQLEIQQGDDVEYRQYEAWGLNNKKKIFIKWENWIPFISRTKRHHDNDTVIIIHIWG
jgi:hypothetical protein